MICKIFILLLISNTHFIECMKQAATTNSNSKCEQGWVERPFSDYCYKFDSSLLTYDQANLKCNQMNGNLVSIVSVEEQLYLQNKIQTGLYWLGANKESFSKGWQWSDKSPFIFTNWALGEYNTNSNQYCAVISSDLNGQWKTVDCVTPSYSFICKKLSTTTTTNQPTTVYPIAPGFNYGCEQGWKQNIKTNYCYKYYGAVSDRKTFDDAKAYCKSYQSDLVEILSENENQFVVSLIPDYSKNLKELKCVAGFQLINNKCYKFINTTTNNWNLAQKFCTQESGILATVKSLSDNLDLANLASEDIWIGLKREKNANTWIHSDDTVLKDYSNWDSSYPSQLFQNDRCVVLKTNNKKWYDIDCNNTLSFKFICQTDADIQDECTQSYSDVFQSNGNCVHKDQCSNGHYVTNKCDQYNDNDLVCCYNKQLDQEGVWLGMYDKLSGINEVSFELLSGMQPTYTNWAPDEPLSEGRCVAMHKKDSSFFSTELFFIGQWMVNKCNFRNNFICKKPVQISSQTSSQTDIGCPNGFKAYETRCFKEVTDLKTWTEAETYCNSLGANLVAITDKFEQYWLNQYQTNINTKWIGLTDAANPGNYKWTTNEVVSYTNWDKNKPDQSNGRCIAMSSTGFWSNYDCNNAFQSVCMTINSYYTTTTPPSTPPPPKCAQGWSDSDNMCYKFFGPKENNDKLNWFDSDSYCRQLGGNLASFRSVTSISNIIRSQNVYQFGSDYGFWFGLNRLDSSFQYSDGSSVSFTSWDFGEPNLQNERENCVEIRSSGKWKDSYCYVNKGWVCSIPKGIEPNATSFEPTTFDIIQCDNNTNYNWTYFNNKCYYASTGIGEEKLNWFKSREFCRNLGGDLLSIHTSRELDYVTTIVSKKLDRWHIGLSQFTPNSGFVWSDGSPVNFINWANGEPNNANGGEKCVEMLSSNSYWNDGNCGVELGFVCEKSANTTNITTVNEVLPLTFSSDDNGNLCPDGYSTFGVLTKNNLGQQKPCSFPFKYNGNLYYECVSFENRNPWCATSFDYDIDKEWGYCVEIKCFRVVTSKKTYGQARIVCEGDGGTLASIHNEIEHAYVTALLKSDSSLDYYIGLWSPGGFTGNSFFYEDNTELTFTKWAPNKPGNLFYNERTVVMSGDSKKPGLWSNVDGNKQFGFVCSQYSNGVKFISSCQSSNRTITLTCPTNMTIMIVKADFGRETYSMTCDNEYFYGICSTSTQTTEKVRSICQSTNNCNLTASNQTFTDNCPNVVKQLKVWYQCVYTPIITTDGNSNNASCVFPFTYKNSLFYQCTYEQHPDYVKKRWCCTTSNCDINFKWGICPESKAPLQTSACTKPGYTSIDSGKNCYKINEENKKNWLDAKNDCETDGGNLVSILDGFEQSYIRLLSYVDTLTQPWIGLIKNNSNQFYWSDNWLIEYSNWAASATLNSSISCVYFDSTTGEWNTTSCDEKRSYICKISAQKAPIITTPPPGKCPDNGNWKAYGSNCYLIDNSVRSYIEADYSCRQQDALVASILSLDESNFIQSLNTPSQTSLWIGLKKNPINLKYEWSDGSPLDYVSFFSSFRSYDCVYMYANQWYDSDCLNNRFKYVCKRPKIIETTTSTTTTTRSTSLTSLIQSQSTFKSTTKTAFTSTTSIQTSKTSTTKTSISSTKIIESDNGNHNQTGIIIGVIASIVLLMVVTFFVLKRKGFLTNRWPFIKLNKSEIDAAYSNRSESVNIVGSGNPNFD